MFDHVGLVCRDLAQGRSFYVAVLEPLGIRLLEDLAFRAPSREAIDRFHVIGLRHGGSDNGTPGVRRGRYYCAFLLDPDGNNVEAGC